jgi:hypothetical protein
VDLASSPSSLLCAQLWCVLSLRCAAGSVATTAAMTIDQFATDYVNNARKETPIATAVRMQVAQNQTMFFSLMTMIFQVCWCCCGRCALLLVKQVCDVIGVLSCAAVGAG